MAANVVSSPVLGENFSQENQKDLRSLSAAIMAATEKAELVAHETDRWLGGHQEFNNLDLVHSLVSEAEGRLVQIRQMTVIQELDRFMQEITANAPEEQAKQLHALMANTKETFSSAIDSLERFVQRSENIDKAYCKYKESEQTLGQVLSDTSKTLHKISHPSDLAEVSDQVEAVKSSRGMLSSMKTCLRNMKDAMAGIESLTLTVCDLGMEHYMREYKQRRAELSDALSRLEAVQSELERFLELYRDCEGSIAELNGALRDPVEDSNEMERLRVQAEQVQLKILDMERMVESLENQNIRSGQRNQLIIIQESYAKLISALSAAYSSSHNGSLTPSPRVKSPHRSPRHRHASDTGTPRQTLRHWLRSKTDELQELMSRPFPFDDKSIQSMWHNIQKYQGDLVVRGEEFSLYATDTDGDQPAMDQITPLIDTCSDLSYRLDSHARLCVQYTADQNGLLAELRGLEEAKGALQHADIALRVQHRMCGDLLEQVTSLKRRVHDQLTNKLPAITVNLAKKEGGAILTDTSELDASVSKLKLELKAFYQSLEASISNLDLLTRQLTDLHTTSSRLDQSPSNFTFNEPISRENVVDALNACKSQLAALAERQQRIDKLLSKKGTAIGLLPIPDDEQLEQTLAESRNTAEKTRRKLQQHESNLTTLQETVERFDTRCDEAKDSLKSAESLLHQASGRGAEKEVLKETIETVTTECKTRLHECVTYIEQAEIAVTEMEQGSSGAGKMSPHKETIKEIQAKHSALSSQLREVETKAAMTAEQQKSLQTLAHKVDDWLEGAEQAVANKVGLDSGLDDMRDHIIKLHELEKSMDGTSGWLTEMKKLCRSLNQGAAAERQEENSQIVGSRDERFEKLGGNLKERTDALSREMEVVIGWIQKNSDLSKQLNDTKYQLTEISSKETNPESISWKLETLQGSIESVQRLLKEYNDLVSCTPPSVSERQRTSATNGQQSCEALLRELNGMHRNLSEVVKIWTDFAQLSGEVKGHLRHCESQLNAVNLPGVSLDARQQRYQEMVEALEKYPDGTSPVYLQEMLSTCSVPSPGLYSEAISLMDDHEKLLSTAKKGAKEFGEQVRVRAEVEQRLKADTFALKEMSDQLQSAAQLDDWSKGSCDSVLRLIQTQETELKALAEKTSSLINAQKQQHASDEETMTLDLKESIDDYGDMEREMTAQLVQEKEVMGLAKEFCQYLSEGVTAVEDWLTRSKDLEEEVKSGRAPAETVEQRLKLCQGEAEEMKKHLQRGRGYAEQIGTSLTNSAQRRLAEQLSNLSGDMIARETELAKLVEEKGQLGRTKALQNEQLQEVEETMKGMVSQVHAVANSTTRSMQDCEDKLKQIEALECQRPEVQSGLDQLYETSKLLTSFMKNGQPAEHEKVVGQLCGEKWNALKAKLQQAKTDTAVSLKQFKDLESQYKQIEDETSSKLQMEIEELEAIELNVLPAGEFDIVAQKAGKCNAIIGELWQKSLAAQELEASLTHKTGPDARKPTRGSELNTQLTRLAARCLAVEESIEATATENRDIRESLDKCLEGMRDVEEVIKEVDETKDVGKQQELLQDAKVANMDDTGENELAKLYQVSNEVVSSAKSKLPPDSAAVMDSIQNLNASLLTDVQVKLGQAERVMDQWNVVHVMQLELETLMNSARQTMSAEIVDSQVALDQQKEMEGQMGKCREKLEEFTMRSRDLEEAIGSAEIQRLRENANHFENSLSGIQQGLDKRRTQVLGLVEEEKNFQKDIEEVNAIVTGMSNLGRQEVTEVTLEKCEQLASQYQEELKKMPAVEKKLEDLVALSIRLGDSSHEMGSMTKVLDLKKDLAATKGQLNQQANAIKDSIRMLLSAPQTSVTHEQWSTGQDKLRAENEDGLRDLHLKVDGTEQMHAEKVMAQLQLYETEDQKLKELRGKIKELVSRQQQLQEASLDPMMLRDWAGQVLRVDSELKQLYMKSEETVKRQANVLEKTHKLIDEGAKRERVMEELVTPQLSNALDLSMESEHCLEEIPYTPVAPHQPTLSADVNAAKLFEVERDPGSVETGRKMHQMITEQEDFQAALADVNKNIGQWQWTLDQDYHTPVELSETLGAIQRAKVQLEKLTDSESAAQEPSLPVLSKSLEALELRCVSELQKAEATNALSQDHKDTLDDIEEEVVACQKYLDYLNTMPGGAEEKLPGVEHKVSKLQRMFQTLKVINPKLCEGSSVPEYLGQLMNDLQVLQGRLEVIPEEDDLQSHGKELYSWQQRMAEHVDERETNSDTEFVERVVGELKLSLGSLVGHHSKYGSGNYIANSLNTYKELLVATRQGLHHGRLLDSEQASDRKDNLRDLFGQFESYNQHLGSFTLTDDAPELKATLSDLSQATQEVQRELWCESENCVRRKEKTMSILSHCDFLIKSLSQLNSEFKKEKIDVARLERQLALLEPEFHGFVEAADFHLNNTCRCPALKDKMLKLQKMWDSLEEDVSNSRLLENTSGPLVQLLSNLQNSHSKLDLSSPLCACLHQALDMLVELDTLNYFHKELYSNASDTDLDIKSSILSIKPKMSAVRGDLKAKLRECFNSSPDVICEAYTWLGEVKPFCQQLSNIAAIDDYMQSLLAYQCDLSQRSYITGLMMSLITSCDHDVIVTSQNTVKVLHEAKMAGSRQLVSAHSLRISYKAYEKARVAISKWVADAESLCKDSPIGSSQAVSWLLNKAKALYSCGTRLSEEKQELTSRSRAMSSEALCSQSAMSDISKQVTTLLSKQESSMGDLSSLVKKIEKVKENWAEYMKAFVDGCSVLDRKECLLETVPSLAPLETTQVYGTFLARLRELLTDNTRQMDRVQPIAHKLRLQLTVPCTLTELDNEVKGMKSRENRICSQRLPLKLERWTKAEGSIRKYEQCVKDITCCLAEIEKQLEKGSARWMNAEAIEASVRELEKLVKRVKAIDWSDVERHASGFEQLTGIVLHQVQHLKRIMEKLRVTLQSQLTEAQEASAAHSHCSQSLHSLEGKLSQLEKDSSFASSSSSLSYKAMLERRSRIEQYLSDLLRERQTFDNLQSYVSSTATHKSTKIDEELSGLECRYEQQLTFFSQQLLQLEGDIIAQADSNELQSAYQDWKNQVIRITSIPYVGDIKDLEDLRLKCMFHINLSPAKKLTLPLISKARLSSADHEQLVSSLQSHEAQLVSLLLKHRLFTRLRGVVTYSLNQLDSNLRMPDLSYMSHAAFSGKVPALKAMFEQHQRSSLVMRQICQELLPFSSPNLRSCLLASVQNSSARWQSTLSRFISQSDESMTVMSNVKQANHSLFSLAKDLGAVRHGCVGPLPDHHDQLQEKQSYADVYQWRLEKLISKSAVLKFDLSSLQSQAQNLTEIVSCFSLSQTLLSNTESLLLDLKSDLGLRLQVWSNYMSEVNTLLQALQTLEKLYMNSQRLTIEELLEEITTNYSLQLRNFQKKSEKMICEGERLLTTTGELYGSAIQHGIASLKNSMKHLVRFSTTRTSKLRDTMSAIFEFEHGMKSLNQWFKSTEASLNFTPPDWQDSSLLYSNQYLQQLEKDISHHSRTVTAVINLCSLLQYDRDAGYDLQVRQELSAVKDRLTARWRRLCEKVIMRKEHLYELAQAWTQMKTQTDSLISHLLRYKDRCDDHSSLKAVKPHSQQLAEFTEMLRDCENRHEEMRLLNNRHRYLIRQNMLDSSEGIKRAVGRCTELWDSVYKTLGLLVKDMKQSDEAWLEFVKERDVLLAKVSNLSLILKTKPDSRAEVERKLSKYQSEVDSLFGLPLSKLRTLCTPDQNRKVDNMIQELTANIEILRSELQPIDDLHNVERELDSFVRQTQDIEHDLETWSSMDVAPSRSVMDALTNEHAVQANGKVADLERRVNQMEERASLRRRITPSISKRSSNESLNGLISESAVRLHDQRHLSPVAGESSGELAQRAARVELSKPASALIGRSNLVGSPRPTSSASLRSSSASYNTFSSLPVVSMPSAFQSPWFSAPRITSRSDKSFSRPSSAAARLSVSRTAIDGPFQKFLTARRRSISGDRMRPERSGRTRSVSLERSSQFDDWLSGNQAMSIRPASATDGPRDFWQSSFSRPPSAESLPSDFLISAPPLMSSLSSEPTSPRSQGRRAMMEGKQLQQDIRHTLEWVDKIEVLHTSVWSCSPTPTTITKITQACRQYNDLLSQFHYFKNLVMSINLLSNLDPANVTERERLNRRWQQGVQYLPSRQLQLEAVVISSAELKKEVDGLCDAVTHAELKILSGTHNKRTVGGEVRKTLGSVRSYISLLTSLLCESEGTGRLLLDTLRSCESKCQNLLH